MDTPQPAPQKRRRSPRLTTTRREMLKLSAATGAALAAMYVAPTFTTVGIPRAYAGISFADIADCQLCDKLGKPRMLRMQLLGTNIDPDEGHDQAAGKVTVVGSAALPDPVWVRASDKSNSFESKAHIWFEGPVDVGGFFDIDSTKGEKNSGAPDPKSRLSSSTYVSYFTPGNVVAGQELQTVGFHTSCSQLMNLGDIYVNLELLIFVSEDGFTVDDCSDIVCEKGMKPGTLTMKFKGDSVPVTEGNSQGDGKVVILGGDADPTFPAEVFILATDKDAHATYFSGVVPKFGTFLIDGGGSKLTSETHVTIWASDGFGGSTGPVLQKFNFHTSCSQPLLINDRFVSIQLLSATLVPR